MVTKNPGESPAGIASAPTSAERMEMMSAERTFPLESGAGGSCREWIQYLHQDAHRAMADANEPLKRIFALYQRENRADRLVNRLVAIEKALHAELQKERAAVAVLSRENKFVQRMLDDKDRQYASLQTEFVALRNDWAWRTIRMIRGRLGRVRRIVRPAVSFPS